MLVMALWISGYFSWCDLYLSHDERAVQHQLTEIIILCLDGMQDLFGLFPAAASFSFINQTSS